MFSDDLRSNRRNVVSCVWFTSDVEWSSLELFVVGVESKKELPEIVSDFSFIVCELIETNFAVTSSNWLINEDKVCIAVPRVSIRSEVEIVLNYERAIFSEETSERRASRTAIQPDNKRISWRIRTGIELPVENITALSNTHKPYSVGFIQENWISSCEGNC